MKFVSVFIIIVLWPLFSRSQTAPWYNVSKLDKLEISIFFDDQSVNIRSYYNYHLLRYAQLAKKNSQKKIVIVHKDMSSISRFRARKVKNFLVERLGFPKENIDLNIGLAPAYMVSKGEKVSLFLAEKVVVQKQEDRFQRKPAVVTRPAAPVEKRAEIEKEYIYINKTPKVKRKSLEVSLGVSDYSFTNTTEELFAWALNAEFKKRVSPHLNLSFDLGYAFSDSKFTDGGEYNLALGLASEFDHLNLNTKVYGRKNWSWIGSDSKFVTVNDLGLHLGLDFKLVRTSSYAVLLSTWTELSLSNTVSEFSSANVLSFRSEITFEWFELNAFISLYHLSRKYKVFNADVVGLNLGYKF